MSEELARLWADVAHVAQSRVAVLEAAVQALESGTADRAQRCALAVEESHKLVGSLDSYGITGGSALALEVAELLDEPAPDAREARELVDRLRALVG